MPPQMAGRGSTGVLSRNAREGSKQHEDLLSDIHVGTTDLATQLGMAKNSHLHEKTHQALATKVQELAAMDAELEMKVAATTKAMENLVKERENKQSGSSAGGSTQDEKIDMEFFLQQMRASVSRAMHGADEKVLHSKAYKDTVKIVVAPADDEDEDDVTMESEGSRSLICPLTSIMFKNPVQNKECKHTYDKDAIEGHIKVKSPAKCPVAGCSKMVTKASLEPDTVMQRLLRIARQVEPEAPVNEVEDLADEADIGETYL